MRHEGIITDYRSRLRDELEQRCSKNPRYSLRSFARDLGLAPSRLSDVMRGRYGLSRAAAESIAQKLGLSPRETANFCDLVESKHARDRKTKLAAKERVIQASINYSQITLDGFQLISDWYHYAILELTSIKGFRGDPNWIAKQLGISPHVAGAAIERLLRMDLLIIDKKGIFRATEGFTASPDGVSSDAIKSFHRQILKKALLAVDFQSVEERDLSSIILAVDERQVPEAKTYIKKFRRNFDAKFGQSQAKTKVYCLSTQFFCIQEKSKEKTE